MSEHPITLLNKVVKSNSNSKNTSPHQPTLYVSTEKKSIEDKYAITNTKTGMYIPTNAPQVFQPKPISVVSIIMDTSVKRGSPKLSDISLHKRPEYTIVSPASSFKIGDFSLFTSDVDTNPEKTPHSDYGTKKIKALPKLQLSSIPTARSDSKDINTQKVNLPSTRKVKVASSLSTPLKASPRPLLNSYRPSDFSKQGIQNSNVQKTVPVKPLPLNTERTKNNNSSGGRKLMLLSSGQEKTGRRANKSEGMPTVMSARQQHQENHAFHKKPNDLTVDFKDCFKPVLNSRSKMMFKNAELLLKKYKDLKFK